MIGFDIVSTSLIYYSRSCLGRCQSTEVHVTYVFKDDSALYFPWAPSALGSFIEEEGDGEGERDRRDDVRVK